MQEILAELVTFQKHEYDEYLYVLKNTLTNFSSTGTVSNFSHNFQMTPPKELEFNSGKGLFSVTRPGTTSTEHFLRTPWTGESH